jgi:hypothetical protein
MKNLTPRLTATSAFCVFGQEGVFKWLLLFGVLVAQVLGLWTVLDQVIADSFWSFTYAFGTMLLLGLMLVPPLLLLPERSGRFELNRWGAVIIPISVVAWGSFVRTWYPQGSWGDFAYAFASSSRFLLQVSSLFGLDGINFFCFWGMSLLFCFWIGSAPEIDTRHSLRGAKEQGEQQHRLFVAERRAGSQRRHAIAFVSVAIVFLLYSELRTIGTLFGGGDLYQEHSMMKAVCLTGHSEGATTDERVAATSDIASRPLFVGPNLEAEKADLILWSFPKSEFFLSPL